MLQPPPSPSVLLHDPHRQHVRCVLRDTLADSDALADATAFVRGIAALYGDRFDVEVDTNPSSSSSSKHTTQEAQNGDGDTTDDSLSATVTIKADASSAGRSRVTSLILRGQVAITQWMKELLETRLATPAAEQPPIRIFVSGDRSQVGKSTVCLGLVGALLRHGFASEDIGYIKPATQCEKPQLVAKFCRTNAITCCDIGPIVFYSGFTREFLKGNTDTPELLLASAKEKVDEIGTGKKVVIVDGVGYPAVGSICGVSNAAVASAVQAPVVLVGKRGVGDAVDSFNLNAAFFESQGVKVLGALFNRLPQDGYYSLKNCKESVSAYFEQFQPQKHVYGFIPEMVQDSEDDADVNGDTPCEPESAEGDQMTTQEAKQAKKVIDTFYEHVNLTQLLEDAKQYQSHSDQGSMKPEAKSRSQFAAKRARRTSPIVNSEAAANENGEDGDEPVIVKRSRAEIQAAAKASGAAGG